MPKRRATKEELLAERERIATLLHDAQDYASTLARFIAVSSLSDLESRALIPIVKDLNSILDNIESLLALYE